MPLVLQLALIVAMFVLTSLTAFADTCEDSNLAKILRSAITNRTQIETTIVEAGLYGENSEQTFQSLAEQVADQVPELENSSLLTSNENRRALVDREELISLLLNGIDPQATVNTHIGFEMLQNLNRAFGRAALESVLKKVPFPGGLYGDLDTFASNRVGEILGAKYIRGSELLQAEPETLQGLRSQIVELVEDFRLRTAELSRKQRYGYDSILSRLDRVISDLDFVQTCERELLSDFLRSQSIQAIQASCDPNALGEENSLDPMCLFDRLSFKQIQNIGEIQIQQTGYWDRPTLIFENGYQLVIVNTGRSLDLMRLAE